MRKTNKPRTAQVGTAAKYTREDPLLGIIKFYDPWGIIKLAGGGIEKLELDVFFFEKIGLA